MEPVVLTRKLAEEIDGINLEGRKPGDRLALSPPEARVLVAEGWASPAPPDEVRRD